MATATGNSCGYSQSQLYHYHCHNYYYAAINHVNNLNLNLNLRSKQFAANHGMSMSSAETSFLFVSGGVLKNNYCSSNSRYRFVVKATETDSSSSSSSSSSQQQQQRKEEKEEQDKEEEVYEVEIEQPYGLKFAKGRDGATYIDGIAPGLSADKTGKFSVGDKVIATSAVFGTEIWPAAEYGRTMYTVRQRIGPLYMKMLKRYGNLDYAYAGELSEKEIIRAERNSGFISDRVREIQMQNYQRKMEQKESRERDLREGLQLYKNAQYEEAREKFESVLGSRPTPAESSVASYNVACCYSKLNQIQAGLSALEDALEAGYEDYKRIRTDPDLANLRTTDEFETLMKRFDESFINENAINAIKSIFGIFNKK